jgi:ABC-type dipeptide/oligopeptide/nickel transport system ATPase subunit
VTHDLRLLPRLADRVVVLDGGRTVEIAEDPRALGSPAGRALLDATRGIAAGTLGDA